MKSEIAVSVDRDFARFGSKSYAINKINSVDVRYRYPYSQAGMWLAGLISLFAGLSAISYLSDGDASGSFIVSLLFSVVFGFLAYKARQRSFIKEYQLFLMTSSSEAQAIESRDEGFIYALRERIEQAMAGQLTA